MNFDVNESVLTFDKTIQVAKGDKTFPYLTLLKLDTYCYIVCHVKNKIPSKKDLLLDRGYSDKGYSWELIDKDEYTTIRKGINCLQRSLAKGVITFSYLLGYCEACGVDLLDYLD